MFNDNNNNDGNLNEMIILYESRLSCSRPISWIERVKAWKYLFEAMQIALWMSRKDVVSWWEHRNLNDTLKPSHQVSDLRHGFAFSKNRIRTARIPLCLCTYISPNILSFAAPILLIYSPPSASPSRWHWEWSVDIGFLFFSLVLVLTVIHKLVFGRLERACQSILRPSAVPTFPLVDITSGRHLLTFPVTRQLKKKRTGLATKSWFYTHPTVFLLTQRQHQNNKKKKLTIRGYDFVLFPRMKSFFLSPFHGLQRWSHFSPRLFVQKMSAVWVSCHISLSLSLSLTLFPPSLSVSFAFSYDQFFANK